MERIKRFGDREGLRERGNRKTKSTLVQHPSLFQPQPHCESNQKNTTAKHLTYHLVTSSMQAQAGLRMVLSLKTKEKMRRGERKPTFIIRLLFLRDKRVPPLHLPPRHYSSQVLRLDVSYLCQSFLMGENHHLRDS
jgi:hypothetical protein